MNRIAEINNHIFFLIVLLFALSGCSSIRPSASLLRDQLETIPQRFEYGSYADLLKEHVNSEGLVDYTAMLEYPVNLNIFYAQLATFSPDSHPELFPTENDRLAYWINAYNSTVMKGVLEYYPIAGVEDVKEPSLLFFFPRRSGFFFFQHYTYGGVETSLYYLENSVIRKRFSDPRVHFALNCASRSCPKLPVTPFTPDKLDLQLESETRKFINNEQFVRFAPKSNTLYLSAIFEWYKEDFVNRLHLQKNAQPSLLAYIKLYAEDDLEMKLQNANQPDIKFLKYDWGLNDQKYKRNR